VEVQIRDGRESSEHSVMSNWLIRSVEMWRTSLTLLEFGDCKAAELLIDGPG
jgi:hypothetical protein